MFHDSIRVFWGASVLLTIAFTGLSTSAQIYRSDNNQVITGTEGLTPGPGINLSGWNAPGHMLEYATFAQTNINGGYANLTGASFAGSDLKNASFYISFLTNADFTNSGLTNVNLALSTLTNANFTGAIVNGTNFFGCTSNGFTAAQLYSTASYKSKTLGSVSLGSNDLTGWNLSGQNLSGGTFQYSTLTGTDFSGAIINGPTNFFQATAHGLTTAQIYGTASYQSGDLREVLLGYNDLTGWKFSNKKLSHAQLHNSTLSNVSFVNANLASANLQQSTFNGANFAGANIVKGNFYMSDLTNATFSDAELRGASFWSPKASTGVLNTIRPDGSLLGLALSDSETLIIRNNPTAITVSTTATFSPTSKLTVELAGGWTSVVHFSAGVTPKLSGTLDMELADGIDPATLSGQTFQLFAWNAPLAGDDVFSSIVSEPGMTWDTSKLYTNGTVTLAPIPEPTTVTIVTLWLLWVAARRPRRLRASPEGRNHCAFV